MMTTASERRKVGDLRPSQLLYTFGVGAVVELGEHFGIPMPHTRTVYACTKLLGDKR